MQTAYCTTTVFTGLAVTSAAKLIALEPQVLPVPGYEAYSVTQCGKVYKGWQQLACIKIDGRSPRVRLYINSKKIKIAVPRLVALTWLPNPNGYTHYIFKDQDFNNCHVQNLQWVTPQEYSNWKINRRKKTAGHIAYEELLGPVRTKKEKPVYNLGGVPVNDFPGYFITKEGVVYKKDRIIAHMKGNRGCLRVKLRYPTEERLYYRAGLATLVAEHFVPNPRKYKHVIFKDRNRLNCHAANLAWVDGETFIHYSGAAKYQDGSARKKRIDRDVAIKQCNDPLLKRYYETLDNYYLQEAWSDIDKRITRYNVRFWGELKSETYMYFVDRCQRFSFLHDPLPLLMYYIRTLKKQLREEVSPDIPVSKLYQVDESLRSNASRSNGFDIGFDHW